MKPLRLALALFSLAVVSCDDSGTARTTANSCTLDPATSPDGTAVLAGDCARDAKAVAAAITRGADALRSAGEIALGRTPFGPVGVFDRCTVMARLADDPRWTASIDSNTAGAPLRDALRADILAPSVSAALAKAGRTLRGVSLEKILLVDAPAKDCAKSPARTPVEAQIWLGLQ
ncbi:hypothetical protein [Sphingomonas montana]|uniref:hypothetical protein n=1 Tax=Sphingomonas montana TaxID=1843236 RepID=UPI00096E242D|nr:hypothetical protein [Sphingomonas montana]